MGTEIVRRFAQDITIDLAREKLAAIRARVDAATTAEEIRRLVEPLEGLAAIFKKRGEENRIIFDAIAEEQTYAERRRGELLLALPKATGVRGQLAGRKPSGGTAVVPPERGAPTLEELGISKKESARAQQLAKLPPETVRANIDAAKEEGLSPSSSVVLRIERDKKVRALHGEKKTVLEIASAIGCDKQVVYVALRRMGLATDPGNNPLRGITELVQNCGDMLEEAERQGLWARASEEHRKEFLKALYGLRRIVTTTNRLNKEAAEES